MLLESLLELIIAKDSLKSSSLSLEQIVTHQFFKEFAASFDQHPSDTSKQIFELPCKDFLIKASLKSEQRLKEEQKLVRCRYFVEIIRYKNVYLIRSRVRKLTRNWKKWWSRLEKKKQNESITNRRLLNDVVKQWLEL